MSVVSQQELIQAVEIISETQELLSLIEKENQKLQKHEKEKSMLIESHYELQRKSAKQQLSDIRENVNSVVVHFLQRNEETLQMKTQMSSGTKIFTFNCILELQALHHKEKERQHAMNIMNQQLLLSQKENEELRSNIQGLKEEIERLQAVRTAEKRQSKTEDDGVSLLTVIWQLTAKEENTIEALSMSGHFMKCLVKVLENAVDDGTQPGVHTLVATLGILVNIAATPQGRSLLFSPSSQNGSAVSELLIPFLLFSRNGEMDDAKELALNVVSNLCLDREGCLLFLNRKLLPSLSSFLKSEKNSKLRSHCVEIITTRLVKFISQSHPSNKKILYSLMRDLDKDEDIKESVVGLYQAFLHTFGEE